MAKPENIKRNVVKILKNANLYRPELTYQVEQLANDIVVYRNLAEKAISLGSNGAVITEDSRDGDRMKPHPIFAMYQAQANQLRQDIKSLLMNYDKTDNKGMVQKDSKNPLKDLVNALDDDDDDDDDD